MNYKKLIEDSRAGKIDWEKWVLVIDNDGGYWRSEEGETEDDWKAYEEAVDQMEAIYGSPGVYRDVVEILEAAGVCAEWC